MGYLQKRYEGKKITIILSSIGLIITFLSFCSILFNNYIFDFINEFRFQIVFITIAPFIYALIKKRFYASVFFSLLIIFNIYIIASPNQMLAEEYAGKDPFIFKAMLHRLDKNHKDFTSTSQLVSEIKPDLAILFLNNYSIENDIGKFKHTAQETLGNGEKVKILSRFPFSDRTSIKDENGKEIAFLVNFPKFKRPISMIVTSFDGRFKFNKKENIKNINIITNFIKTRKEPVMIVGGFNNAPWSNMFKDLHAYPSKTQAGFHPDFPSYLPSFLRLSSNYIYTLPGLSVFNVDLLKETDSNYNPILFTVAIERKKRH